jgi:hypothetical protein
MRNGVWKSEQSSIRPPQELGQLLAAAAVTLAALTGGVAPAAAEAAAPSGSSAEIPTVYFGNGCFW